MDEKPSNLENRIQEDLFEKELREERPVNKAVVGLVSAGPALTAINMIVNYSQGDTRNAVIYGIGTIVSGAVAFGAYKIYKHLYNDD